VCLTVSRQQQSSDNHDDDSERTPSYGSPLDTDQTCTSAPPSELKSKQSNNGASSPALRCLATKTDENDNPIDDRDVELIEMSIALNEDDAATSGLGISIKGMSSERQDLGLFVRRILEGRAAAKVGAIWKCITMANK